MNARPTWVAAGLLLAACGASGGAAGGGQEPRQAVAQSSHHLKSIDEAFEGAKYLKDVRIQPEQAKALALKVFDGRILYQRIESRPGGSGLRYSFVIGNDRTENHQVDIDANDGATLLDVETDRFRQR